MNKPNPMTVNGEKWIVSLSNGHTYSEEDMADEPARISPWSKLVDEVLPRERAYITQLRIQVLGRTYTCLPNSDRSKFHTKVKPISYLCMRRCAVDAFDVKNSASRTDHIGMWAELPNGWKITTWVDVYTGDSWQQIQ